MCKRCTVGGRRGHGEAAAEKLSVQAAREQQIRASPPGAARGMQLRRRMKELLQTLADAQTALRHYQSGTPERETVLEDLRKNVPAPVLAHFLRLVGQGRSGVSVVRHGVCGGCHLRVPAGVVASLKKPTDLHLCENCGSYLVLAPEELAAPATATATVPARRRPGRPRAVMVA